MWKAALSYTPVTFPTLNNNCSSVREYARVCERGED